jgi:hypothetical protein
MDQLGFHPTFHGEHENHSQRPTWSLHMPCAWSPVGGPAFAIIVHSGHGGPQQFVQARWPEWISHIATSFGDLVPCLSIRGWSGHFPHSDWNIHQINPGHYGVLCGSARAPYQLVQMSVYLDQMHWGADRPSDAVVSMPTNSFAMSLPGRATVGIQAQESLSSPLGGCISRPTLVVAIPVHVQGWLYHVAKGNALQNTNPRLNYQGCNTPCYRKPN